MHLRASSSSSPEASTFFLARDRVVLPGLTISAGSLRDVLDVLAEPFESFSAFAVDFFLPSDFVLGSVFDEGAEGTLALRALPVVGRGESVFLPN